MTAKFSLQGESSLACVNVTVRNPFAGGDPKHLVLEVPGGKGQPLSENDDEPVRQVALHLNDQVKKGGPDWTW